MSFVTHFGAMGDGKADDTGAILHALESGDGAIDFPRGTYRITKTINVPLDTSNRTSLRGDAGTATVIMDGPGPAFRIIGTHSGTADPNDFQPKIWQKQRMPSLTGFEIIGSHPEADGIELTGTMQAMIEGMLLRQLRDGIRLVKRNRNPLIANNHIYHNTGAGIRIDRCNLHQINISGNHISYNRVGGIRIEGSEVRNLQITGNDIEYNNHRAHESKPEPTAEIYVDTTGDASVNEVTIASNTIQATVSDGGANIRIKEDPDVGRPPGLWSIAGNIIGSQENNVHLTGCHGIVLSGNFIYSCGNRNLLIEDSSQVNVTGNSFRRHGTKFHTGIRIVRSKDIVLNGCTIQDHAKQGQTTGASLLELQNCQRVNLTGCQLLDGVPFGIDAKMCSQVCIASSTILDTRQKPLSKGSIRFSGKGSSNYIQSCILPKEGGLEFSKESGAQVSRL